MPEDWREKKLHKKKAILIKIYKEMARVRKELCAIRSLLEENKADTHLKESGQEKAAYVLSMTKRMLEDTKLEEK